MLLHYQSLATFKRIFFAPLLTAENIEGAQLHIDKVKLPDEGEIDNYNFWGYKLVKEGTKYLLPASGKGGKEIVLKDTLPIMVTRMEKVAYRNDVYHVIKKYSSARFGSERTMSFKQFVDKLSAFKHTNPAHYKLLYFIALSQLYYRSNFRVCSPPSFGKDSIVDTLGYLVGGCATIVQPTRAKLEFRASLYNLLALNEASDIGNAEWELIQSFLLDAGAFKGSIEKQTRAFGMVGESIDISRFSLLIIYNDIFYVAPKNHDKYIDARAHKALLDRFPPLRLHGKLTENFPAISTVDVPAFVTEHMDEYKELIKNFTHYKENLALKGYKRDKLADSHMPERWKLSLNNLLNIIDMYCDSQKEFDEWIAIINASMQDYSDMLAVHASTERYEKQWGAVKYSQLWDQAAKYSTYTEKRKFLEKPDAAPKTAYDWESVKA